MSVSRLEHITKIGVEQMGELADSLDDPEILRLENLDTDDQLGVAHIVRIMFASYSPTSPLIDYEESVNAFGAH